MIEVSGASHSDVRITDLSLTDAQLSDVDVTRANFWRVRMRGVWIGEAEINGQIEGLRINGVEVGPLIEAELDRRHPHRATMRPDDIAGFHEAWDILSPLWAGTVDRARALPPELLHERVDGEVHHPDAAAPGLLRPTSGCAARSSVTRRRGVP